MKSGIVLFLFKVSGLTLFFMPLIGGPESSVSPSSSVVLGLTFNHSSNIFMIMKLMGSMKDESNQMKEQLQLRVSE